MSSYAVGRIIFLARSLGISQAVRSAALIGASVAAPTDGVAVDDVKPTEFEEIVLVLKAAFAYTGGTTNPTLQVRVQRKFAVDLPDADDNAWEDLAAWVEIGVDVERVVRLGLLVLTTPTLDAAAPEYALGRDNIAAGQVRVGHPGEKIRIRESVSGGDRTGGNLTYDLRFFGLAVG